MIHPYFILSGAIDYSTEIFEWISIGLVSLVLLGLFLLPVNATRRKQVYRISTVVYSFNLLLSLLLFLFIEFAPALLFCGMPGLVGAAGITQVIYKRRKHPKSR